MRTLLLSVTIALYLCLPQELRASDIDSDSKIFVVAKQERPVHQRLVESMQSRLQSLDDKAVEILSVEQLGQSLRQRRNQSDLIVPIGTDVTLAVVDLKLANPVLSVAIPKLSYDQLQSRYADESSLTGNNRLSALFLDQPWSRRFSFIQKLLPEARNFAVALGPGTQKYQAEITSEASSRGLKPLIGKITDDDNLIATLETLFEQSDLMLGIVDPLVFNRSSSRNILLTAHRWRIPLIGISPAYVRAGALAAVYSTPEQIGTQVAEVLRQYRQAGSRSLPAPRYPAYFEISINYRVAESLGMFIAPENELKKALMEEEIELK